MTTYKEWAPTAFDPRGLNGDRLERNDWLVAPVLRQPAMDDPKAESNFATALTRLGGESSNVELHHFGHWTADFDIILVRPHTEEARELQRITDDLEDSPHILDEDDYYEREYDMNTASGMVISDDTGEWVYPDEEDAK